MNHKVTKRLFSGLLALALVLSLFSWGANTADATAYTGCLSQHDPRWGSYNVNGGTISATGCGIVSLVNAVGYLSGKPDGQFGQWTAAAVKEAQKDLGFEQTGVADAAFLDVLYTK